MKLTQSGSLWGNLYRLRHYQDGRRISDTEFRRLFQHHKLTPEMGIQGKRKSSSFRIDWIIQDARTH